MEVPGADERFDRLEADDFFSMRLGRIN